MEKALGEGLVGHARYEAAGLLELRGAMPLYTFPFLFFFTLAERRVSASGAHLWFWRTYDYSTCHPWVRPFEAAMGREQLSLLLVGFPVTRAVLPWPVRAPPQDDDFPKRLFPGGMMDR